MCQWPSIQGRYTRQSGCLADSPAYMSTIGNLTFNQAEGAQVPVIKQVHTE